MMDWVGSLRISERSAARIVLRLSRTTRWIGAALLAAGLLGIFELWSVSRWLCVVPAAITGVGFLLTTLDRELRIDRRAGVLEVHQKICGISSHSVVPLFHLRAVVVSARPAPTSAPGQARYVAFLERRIGEAIYLDEARRCAGLLAMAEAIADVAELRLEYDASARAN